MSVMATTYNIIATDNFKNKTDIYFITLHSITRKTPDGIMDGFLNKKFSESCLSCMENTYWSSSSSPPNMKAIHWRIKITYNFEKRLTKRFTWDDARPPTLPDIAILKAGFF